MYEQCTECIQFWAVLQLDINGFIKSKKKWEERNKQWALKLIDCPIYNFLAEMFYIFITEKIFIKCSSRANGLLASKSKYWYGGKIEVNCIKTVIPAIIYIVIGRDSRISLNTRN